MTLDSSEAQLVRFVLRGDQSALGRLLEIHQHRLFNVALRMVGSRDDAAEVTQDALLKIVQHIHDFKGDSQIGTWMVRIVMNLAISHLRKRRLRQTVSLDGSAGEGPGQAGDPAADSPLRSRLADSREPQPVQSVQQKEMLGHLQTALARLDEEFRAVIVLRDIDGLDYQQIAGALGVPVGTVKSRLFRARLALRHEMFKLCPPDRARSASGGATPGPGPAGDGQPSATREEVSDA